MADDKKKNKQLTLKRRVTIKAIVTDKFKEYLKFELDENKRQSDFRLSEIDAQLGQTAGNEAATQQLNAEKAQLQSVIGQMPEQIKQIDGLENDSIFNQGVIDGFVNVNVGDNLYEKLGGVEVTVKDGIVQDISMLKA